MRTVNLVVFLIFSVPVRLFSQNVSVLLEQGIGSYRMNDLKQLNIEVLNSLPFAAKVTENFPLYWNYKLSLMLSIKNDLDIGATCSFQSTGSRISRVDYSGEYSFDSKINALSPGIIAEIHIPLNKLRISFNNEVGIEYSKILLIEHIKISSNLKENRYSFKSQNWYYEPTVRLSYPILFFRLGITGGYLFDFKKGIVRSIDSNNFNIKLSDGKLPTADWSGMRLCATLSFNMSQLFKKDEQVQ